ncbi:MAG: hypothetical protein A2653_01625 [Candidatus Zambryskibacteria bacterium RIFCSPHIGHO2_01_FULL_43_25]|uniref:Uncharacterized protein n=1 Tax=Candidatus Zambryskibacteria bacterium RIFCSPLOWO2_01_FULL_45_21 TaxID=1802761 RepID=A0A1G2U1G9_9BACT|nr:MAG: hypothetical protein A2653_01625 [Candidatus Zambryskibacteria bacterium RIFCSPHIGHO2_01_FULL_43_25]OHB00257.1 MAG: hypothetical protein A3E94_00765 [Candidatus Zambryskibacteria bacterium RIFCSPHIGHO2_12_FULL_44_12b]OHB03259.1 MAG: hypothetical protein A3B14_00595 [Candidatus Zambryskibacteria bacterium RIFCSPLOWO2_01_FULL_45_21]
MWLLYVIPDYTRWHYSGGLKALWRNVRVFFTFLVHLFSLPILVRTIFLPWRRMNESYKKGFDPGDFFSTLVVNTVLRLVGFVIRLVVILVGVCLLALATICSVLIVLSWLLAPLIVVFLLSLGFANLAGS